MNVEDRDQAVLDRPPGKADLFGDLLGPGHELRQLDHGPHLRPRWLLAHRPNLAQGLGEQLAGFANGVV